MLHSRIKRVEEMIGHTLAEIFQRELKDPRLEFVTLTRVEVSRDLQHAVVFVSSLDDTSEHVAELLGALEHARGFLKRELGQRIRLRYLPDLQFRYDGSAAYAMHIQQVIHRLNEQE